MHPLLRTIGVLRNIFEITIIGTKHSFPKQVTMVFLFTATFAFPKE